jgi:hypothetical protein
VTSLLRTNDTGFLPLPSHRTEAVTLTRRGTINNIAKLQVEVISLHGRQEH